MVGSTNPTPIVLTIIAINVVVFFLEGFGTNARVVDRYAMWPAAVHVQHQYYRAFTAMWLHASFTHIFFNMIALLIVGPALEVLLGKARFLALYLLAGLGGSVGSYLLASPTWPGIGASGAIMGVLGAYVVIGLRRRLPVAPVVGLLVLNFVIGFTGDIDWRAHLGGLVTGCVLAFVYDYAGQLRDRTTALVLTVGGSVAVLAVLALLITVHRPGPRQSQLSPGQLVDSETKIAVLCHSGTVTAARPEAGGTGAPTGGRDGVVRHLGADDRSSTRVRIVDGALRCLARQGIAKTTVDDIARAAGLSRATAYRTFPRGKEGILAAVVETEVARLFSCPRRRHGRGQRPRRRPRGRHGRVGPPAAPARRR